jgi:tetratricopeptide (TPR) repeat protein
MKKVLLLLFSILSIAYYSNAQDYRKINGALRFVKLGNTLREAQQYELSERYLRQGLDLIISSGDRYWEAATYESLGFLFKDQDNTEEASRYFSKALVIFRELKMSLSEKALEQLLNGTQGKEQLYAGIEIGSKGVKLSILGVQLNSSGEVEYVLKSDSSINPEPAALTPQSQLETSETVKRFLDFAKAKYGIPADKMYVVMSSGLKTELDKKNKTNEFITAITPANAPKGFTIRSVTSSEEAELTVLGTVPPKRRFTTSLIDVGSNKTNGGYFIEGTQSFDAVFFPVGTKSFVKNIKNKNPYNISDFNRWAENLWRDSLSQSVRDELSRRPGLKNRAFMYLGGGVVWCIATYLYPQKVNDNYVELTHDDIRRFRALLVNSYEKAIQPDLGFIGNEALLMDARKTISRAQNTYDQEALIAGIAWVDGLMRELNTTQPTKRFFFSKYSYVGWISGYIAREVAEEFKKKNEK